MYRQRMSESYGSTWSTLNDKTLNRSGKRNNNLDICRRSGSKIRHELKEVDIGISEILHGSWIIVLITLLSSVVPIRTYFIERGDGLSNSGDKFCTKQTHPKTLGDK